MGASGQRMDDSTAVAVAVAAHVTVAPTNHITNAQEKVQEYV